MTKDEVDNTEGTLIDAYMIFLSAKHEQQPQNDVEKALLGY